ncbi:hypothetical protein [Micromonospora sp. NPDC093277]|uniref:hypothetical protein n=1 Tax=Micromonospora sp. NPDC093277 TaxID=3364291 RepID=UPI00382360CE
MPPLEIIGEPIGDALLLRTSAEETVDGRALAALVAEDGQERITVLLAPGLTARPELFDVLPDALSEWLGGAEGGLRVVPFGRYAEGVTVDHGGDRLSTALGEQIALMPLHEPVTGRVQERAEPVTAPAEQLADAVAGRVEGPTEGVSGSVEGPTEAVPGSVEGATEDVAGAAPPTFDRAGVDVVVPEPVVAAPAAGEAAGASPDPEPAPPGIETPAGWSFAADRPSLFTTPVAGVFVVELPVSAAGPRIAGRLVGAARLAELVAGVRSTQVDDPVLLVPRGSIPPAASGALLCSGMARALAAPVLGAAGPVQATATGLVLCDQGFGWWPAGGGPREEIGPVLPTGRPRYLVPADHDGPPADQDGRPQPAFPAPTVRTPTPIDPELLDLLAGPRTTSSPVVSLPTAAHVAVTAAPAPGSRVAATSASRTAVTDPPAEPTVEPHPQPPAELPAETPAGSPIGAPADSPIGAPVDPPAGAPIEPDGGEPDLDRSPVAPHVGEPAAHDFPVPVVPAGLRLVGPPAAPAAEDRAELRRGLNGRYDSFARSVSRLLAEQPGLRAGGGDNGTVTGLVALRAYFANARATTNAHLRGPEREASADGTALLARCAAYGLRRLPVALGPVFVVSGADDLDVFAAYRPGEEIAEPAFLDARLTPGGGTGVQYAIWSASARRLGLLGAPDGGSALFPPGSRFAVLAVDPTDEPGRPRVLLQDLASVGRASVGATGKQMVARLRAALAAAPGGSPAAVVDFAPGLDPNGVPFPAPHLDSPPAAAAIRRAPASVEGGRP